jgi:hypothetical protein
MFAASQTATNIVAIMTSAVDPIHEGFLFRLYGYTLSKLVDGNFVGLDLFYRINDCWKERDTPSDILLRPNPKGLSYKIGEWSFDNMTATEDIGESALKPYYLQLGPEDLFWYVDEFVNALISAGAHSDNPLIVECRSVLEKADQLFDEGWGDGGEGEKSYWKFVHGKGRKRLRRLYRKLHAEHAGPLAFMKSFYASEIADRIVHDRQLCSFIAKLLLQIGFDGEDVDGIARQWVDRCNWPVAIKRIIAARDRGKCADCGVDIMHELEADAHFDHIVPISRGGCNDVVNLQLLCESCNGAKRAELRPVRSSVPRYVKRRSKGVSAA